MESTTPPDAFRAVLQEVKRAILTVNAGDAGRGRGFVIETPEINDGEQIIQPAERFVITAAHCLPHLPPPHPFSYTEERTYRSLLGPLNGDTTVCAECLFVDPVADVAVLREPDNQELADESSAYTALVEAGSTLRVAAVAEPVSAWLLRLDGAWEACCVRVNEYGPTRTLTLIAPPDAAGIAPGTSGSPIVGRDGSVYGLWSVTGLDNEHHGQPLLMSALPAWLSRALRLPV